ncbi:12997_t:CDS:10 [Entrophospora sp. SA101]|nr:12997_t:CDS:10 [Entrophospora sp. SA101]
MSTITCSLPIIDLGLYLKDKNSELAIEECHKTAKALKDYGALLIKDPRVTEDDNSRFLMPKESRPLISEGPDPKWRFFWRIGELPEQTKFPQLNSDPVVPEAFKDVWSTIMNQWGKQLHQAVVDVVEMTSVGFGMAANYLPDLTKKGPHLLAPTGSDLNKYGKLGTILAGFHYDLNFVTIHGKSRFPGLNIWPRNGSEKINVRVPDGHLLVQAGKQLEWLTGGEVKAGYHEVIVTEATIKKIRPNRPLWRISSTFFLHIASDNLLKPIEPFFKPNPSLYPPIATGDQMLEVDSKNNNSVNSISNTIRRSFSNVGFDKSKNNHNDNNNDNNDKSSLNTNSTSNTLKLSKKKSGTLSPSRIKSKQRPKSELSIKNNKKTSQPDARVDDTLNTSLAGDLISYSKSRSIITGSHSLSTTPFSSQSSLSSPSTTSSTTSSSSSSLQSPSTSNDTNECITTFLAAPRLTQRVRLKSGRVVSFSEVGDRNGFPVFVFLGMGCVRYFIAFFDDLASSYGLRLLCPDRPGVGLSDDVKEDQQHILKWPDIIKELCEILSIDKFFIMAHSAGAPYALACAIKIPEKLQGTIYLVCPWISTTVTNNFKWLKYVPTPIMKFTHTAGISLQQILNGKQPYSTKPSHQRNSGASALPTSSLENKQKLGMAILKASFAENLSGANNDLMMCFERRHSFGFSYTDIDHPVHVFHGTKDDRIPVAAVKWMENNMPDCKLTLIEGGKHSLLLRAEIVDTIFKTIAIQLHDKDKCKACKLSSGCWLME